MLVFLKRNCLVGGHNQHEAQTQVCGLVKYKLGYTVYSSNISCHCPFHILFVSFKICKLAQKITLYTLEYPVPNKAGTDLLQGVVSA